MKLVIIFLVTLLGSLTIFAQQEPLMKIYMDDGSTKLYNLKDIDSLGIIDNKNFYDMKIQYQDSLIAYYPTEIIGSIKFETDTNYNQVMNVYLFGYPKTYVISSIDSIIFYKDIYQPLTIGSQVWMLKNLNIDHYRNGDSIPEVRDSAEWVNLNTGAWCYYNNNPDSGKIYGKLYNWYAVNDPRGFAPKGWHVVSDSEWVELENCLGGDSVAGGKLKETGTTHWFIHNNGASNSSGFSALPGGLRFYGGVYFNIGYCGYWWSSTKCFAISASFRYQGFNGANISRNCYDVGGGFSVRCVRD